MNLSSSIVTSAAWTCAKTTRVRKCRSQFGEANFCPLCLPRNSVSLRIYWFLFELFLDMVLIGMIDREGLR